MGKVISAVIIDDDDITRDNYAAFINAQDGYAVANTYRSYENAVARLVLDAPDVILLGVEPSGTNTVDTISRLKKIAPDSPVLILTTDEQEAIIFGALGKGASGFFNKDLPPDKLVEAIKEVIAGGTPMSLNIARLIISSFQKNQDSPLSKRETQVLEMIGNGKSRSQVARELFIDLETVRSHIKNIYGKLGVNSRSAAIKAARGNKFI